MSPRRRVPGAAPAPPVSLLDVLKQDQWWWPAKGPATHIHDLQLQHAENIMKMLRRLGPMLYRQTNAWQSPDDHADADARWLYDQAFVQCLWDHIKCKRAKIAKKLAARRTR